MQLHDFDRFEVHPCLDHTHVPAGQACDAARAAGWPDEVTVSVPADLVTLYRYEADERERTTAPSPLDAGARLYHDRAAYHASEYADRAGRAQEMLALAESDLLRARAAFQSAASALDLAGYTERAAHVRALDVLVRFLP